ncbi:MAG: hypothetical protein MJZ89_02140 [Paludibacteraceae bacterium]|nr:hypothetical protein [Paludibacteraceae bacterium]
MKPTHYIALLSTILLIACSHTKETWVDLNDFSSLNPKTCFMPMSNQEDCISEELMMNCYLPGGERIADALREDESQATISRTSSVSAQQFAKELFSHFHGTNLVSFIGTYESIDGNGNPIRLSGRIILPKNKKISRIMLVSHYTIGANYECPSKAFPLEGIFAARGLALIIPDYIGFGITADHVHPYLNVILSARNVVDMYMAAKPFLEYIGCKPEHDDIFLLGYSQGGATTLAVQRELELHYPNECIRLNMAGGGPYDVCATYDQIIQEDNTDYPCAIPMLIQGLNESMNLDLDYAKYFSPVMLQHMDEWLNSKKYSAMQITELIGSKQVSLLLTEEAQNKVTETMSKLYMAMLSNSMTANFTPKAPIYIFHSTKDNVVPFVNAYSLQNSLSRQQCNVRYNCGDFGSHGKSGLRFLYTCLNLLSENNDIPNVF